MMRGLVIILATVCSVALAFPQEPPQVLPPEAEKPQEALVRDPETDEILGAWAAPALAPGACLGEQDCPLDQGCVEGKCINTCEGKPCGKNAHCHVVDHLPTCVCDDNFSGDPSSLCDPVAPECTKDEECSAGDACYEGQCLVKECVGKKCGDHALCQVADGAAACVCIQGFSGDAATGCVPPPPPPAAAPTPDGVLAGPVRGPEVNQHLCEGKNFPKYKGKKQYFVSNFKANWYDAYMYCISHGRRLATVENKEENEQILEKIHDTGITNGIFFISGTDNAKLSRWVWMTTGLPITEYTNWHTTTYGYRCLSYWAGFYGTLGYKWVTASCVTEHNFICEDYVG